MDLKSFWGWQTPLWRGKRESCGVYAKCGEYYLYDMGHVAGIVPVIRTDSRNGNTIKVMQRCIVFRCHDHKDKSRKSYSPYAALSDLSD